MLPPRRLLSPTTWRKAASTATTRCTMLWRCRCAHGAACRYGTTKILPRQADDQHGAGACGLENIRAGRQSISLLNRRRYRHVCRVQGLQTVAACPNCSISMTYHAANNRLMCHYCGHSEPAYVRCKACGGELTFSAAAREGGGSAAGEAFRGASARGYRYHREQIRT